MSDPNDASEILRKKFCPPLDEALFSAIASDYDLNEEHSKRELETALSSLTETAVAEQDLELLEDGSGKTQYQVSGRTKSYDDQHSSQTTGSILNESNHDDTENSVTTRISQLQLSDNGKIQDSSISDFGSEAQSVETGSVEEQTTWLQNMFPFIHEVQIGESLTKSQGNFDIAIDELLNLSFIHQDFDDDQKIPIPVVKGVDGFAETDHSSKKRKARSKKNRHRAGYSDYDHSDSAISSGSTTPVTNVWNTMSTDMEFLTLHIDLPAATLKSLYHENSTNLSKTIKTLLDKEAQHYDKIQSEDINVQLQIEELRYEMPSLSDAQLYAALSLTRFMPTTAKEVLETMLHPPTKSHKPTTSTMLIPSYTPINLSDNEDKPPPRTKTHTSSNNPADTVQLAQQALNHSTLANHAANQASASYRRGKSNPLYGGAAAYYASVAQDHRARQREYITSASDALVSQQSTSTSLDLHGVTVEQARRIACERVATWWDALGDRKLMYGGIGEGFRIITGVGSHSERGIAKLGPAVTKALMGDGWRVNVQRGEIFVEGRR